MAVVDIVPPPSSSSSRLARSSGVERRGSETLQPLALPFTSSADPRSTPSQPVQQSHGRRRRRSSRYERSEGEMSHAPPNSVAQAEAQRQQRMRQQQREDAFQQARQEAHDELEALHELRSRRRATEQRQLDRAFLNDASSPQRPSSTPAPPHQHRVYLIDCRSCGAFLTDRGMKAVLLLRPHITLYSTDAMPNCGPLHAPPRLTEPSAANEPVLERTCDCLTQTLGCFGCGSAVGYHIVSPCDRCTSSVAKHQRSSNGHRTVLHCAEIVVRERRYVPGEPGVKVAPFRLPLRFRPPMNPAIYHQLLRRNATTRSTPMNDFLRHPSHLPPPPSTLSSHPRRHILTFESLTTRSSSATMNVPVEEGAGDHEEWDEDDDPDCDDDGDEEEEFPDSSDKSMLEQSNGIQGSATANGHVPRALKRGDVLFWSDLVAGGERAAPIDSDDLLSMPVAGR